MVVYLLSTGNDSVVLLFLCLFLIIIISNNLWQCLWCCHHRLAIAKINPVHLMNVERRQAAADPRASQTTYSVWVRLYRLPESTPTIAIYCYYSARKLILIYRTTEDRRRNRPSWLVTYQDGLPVHRRSPILVLTGSDVAQLQWSRPTRYH